jgi:hypothetical protein
MAAPTVRINSATLMYGAQYVRINVSYSADASSGVTELRNMTVDTDTNPNTTATGAITPICDGYSHTTDVTLNNVTVGGRPFKVGDHIQSMVSLVDTNNNVLVVTNNGASFLTIS